MKNQFNITLLLIVIIGATPLFAFNIPGFGKKTDSAEEAAKAAEQATSAADIKKSLLSSISQAEGTMGDNPEMKSLLNNIQKQATGGEDLSMLQSLSGLAGGGGAGMAMMTPEQKELVAEVKGHAQALALTRNFSDDPELAGPVSKAIKAVQSRDPMAAASSLKAISEKGSLSPLQQNMLKAMLGDYGQYLDSASKAGDALNSVKSLF